MDSRQHTSGAKRGNIFEGKSTQNPDEPSTCNNDGENSCIKRRKLETNPMKMGNVVEKVLSFVNVKTVKELREVSKVWSSEGAKRLFKRCYVSISWDLQALLLDKYLGNTRTEEDEFEAFLAHRSSNIPNITVQRDCDFAVWKSLGVLGPKVNCLKLTYIDDQAELLHKLFHNLLPNLKYLDLKGMTKTNFHTNDEHLFRFLSSVMADAPESRCPLVVSSMHLLLKNKGKLEEVDKFLDCSNIKFENLRVEAAPVDIRDVSTFEAKTTNILWKLLSNSQDTLKSLMLDGCDLILYRLKFPCLTSLTHLDFIFYELSDFEFSPSFRFSKNMPNLVELGISFEGDEVDVAVFEGLFENTGTAPSVKRFRLDYYDKAVDDVFGCLFQRFPNIEDLEAFGIYLSKEALLSLWSLGKGIKKLGISFQFGEFGADFPDLDSIFAGFSPETAKHLKEKLKLDQDFVVKN